MRVVQAPARLSARWIEGLPEGSYGHRDLMEIPKEQILKLLRERGQDDKVAEADRQLPEQVDPEAHADLLGKLGIDPGELLGGGLGGLGDKLGL